jgi:large subunit ribosomal protein L24
VQVKKSLRSKGAHIRTQARAPVGRLHVKKGDVVLVLSGNDKGKTGEIKEAFPRDGRVLVEGVNLRWRHNKPTQKNPKGERIQREAPIHASNVRLATGPAKQPKKAAKSTAAPKAPKSAAPKAPKKKS